MASPSAFATTALYLLPSFTLAHFSTQRTRCERVGHGGFLRHLLVIFLFITSITLLASDIPSWPHAFMSDDAKSLRATAEKHKATSTGQAGIRMLSSEKRYHIDADGKRSETKRETFLISNYEGLREYDSLEATWRPWYQGRPQIRARVILPNGESHLLREQDIVESAAKDGDDNQFSEDRRLRAPLPRAVVGSIIETETVIPGVRPFFSAGDAWGLTFVAEAVPQKLEVDVPENLPLSFTVDPDIILDYQSDKANGRVIHRWILVKPPPETQLIDILNRGAFPRGWIRLATGASWQAVAAAYAQHVDQALENQTYPFDLQAWVVPNDARATALRFMLEMERAVRYTGLYLGDKDLVPTRPAVVLERGYGDCKDKATLLTGMLRHVGIKAHLALVNSFGTAIPEETPGLGVFNHAIVVVTREDGSLTWLDPTVTLNRAGVLPFRLSGSRALIAAPDSKNLVVIENTTADAHGATFALDIDMRPYGAGTTVVHTSAYGNREVQFRQDFRDAVEDYDGTPEEQGTIVKVLSMVPADDLSRPWTRDVAFEGHAGSMTDYETAQLQLPLNWVFDELPWGLIGMGEEEAAAVRVAEAGSYRITYKLQLPAGFKLESPFPTYDFKTEHLSFSMTANQPDQGVAALRFAPGFYSQAEVAKIRDFFHGLNLGEINQHYRHEGMRLFQEGDFPAAFEQMRRERDQSGDAVAHFRLAFALQELGLQEPAMAELEKGLALPYSAHAAFLAVSIAVTNFHGQELGAHFPRKHALAMIDQVLARFPDNLDLNVLRVMVNDTEGSGLISTNREQLDRGYAAVAKSDFSELSAQTQHHLMLNRLMAGDYDTLKKLAREAEPPLRKMYEVTAAACQSGPAQALQLADRAGDLRERVMVQLQAAELVSWARHYETALALFDAVKHPQVREQLQARRQRLARTKAVDLNQFPEDDPTTPIFRMIVNATVFDTDKPFRKDQIYLDAEQSEPTGMQDTFAELAHKLLMMSSENTGLTQAAIWDAVIGTVKPTFLDEQPADGPAQGRILRLSFDEIGNEVGPCFWVVPGKKGYRIAAILHQEEAFGEGLRRVAALGNDQAIARLIDELSAEENKDAFSHLLRRDLLDHWRRLNPEGQEDYALAAAFFGPSELLTRKDLKKLQAFAKELEPSAFADRVWLQIAFGWADLGNAKKGASLYEKWYQEQPDFAAVTTLMHLYIKADLHDKEAALFAEQEAKGTDTFAFRRHRVTRLLSSRDYVKIKAEMARAAESKTAQLIGADNDLAWLALFFEEDDLDVAVKKAESSLIVVDPIQGRVRASSATFHTLATLYATKGDHRKARDMLRQSLQVDRRFSPKDEDWYVLGVVAHKLGFPEAAKTYFQRVPEDDDAVSTYQLAKRRLAELADDQAEKGGETDAKNSAGVP